MKKILLLMLLVAFTGVAEDKRIVLLAGARSHRPGDHEFRAGCILLFLLLGFLALRADVFTSN